jgi:hypothetical protein
MNEECNQISKRKKMPLSHKIKRMLLEMTI